MRLVPQGRPRYPYGYRLHHGAVGLGLLAASALTVPLEPKLAAFLGVVGGILVADDWHDRPWAFDRREIIVVPVVIGDDS